MPFNVKGAVEVPQEVFGSWCTEMAPVDLPKGVSPDNQDVVFAPGFVGSRPALQRVFGSPFPAGGPNNYVPAVVGGGSFTAPNGSILNFYFDSNGVLWLENLTTAPGVYSKLLQSTPGSFFRMSAIKEFGRAYIAISDGLNGQEVPLEYDAALGLRRVTQDGPAAAPAVTSLALPSTSMAVSGTNPPQTVVQIETTGYTTYDDGSGYTYSYYSTVTVTLSALATAPNVGDTVVIAGATALNGTYVVIAVNGLLFDCSAYNASYSLGTSGTSTVSGALTAQRANNQVSVTTTAAHRLQVGNQVQITGLSASAVGGGISSIAIKNEDLPGLATITMASAHGLAPNEQVTITGVNPVAVGGATSAVSNGSVTTLTTTTAHGLAPGAVIKVSGFTGADQIFNGTFVVAQTPTTTTLVYYQPLTDTSATVSGSTTTTTQVQVASSSSGAVSLTWPVSDNTETPTYFEVVACPTPTTFTIQISYSDGTWTSGAVSFPWDGIFYVTAVANSTSLQYQQNGPAQSTTQVGTVTPYGQIAPGLHYCQLLFLLDDGTVTAPSPPTSFIANGGQYVSVSNIVLGPPNVKARILVFSGAQPNIPGSQPPMFYLPVAPNVTGMIVGTATQIDDNTTTSIVLDFSDNSLFAGIGISVPGNNLRSQIVLDGALGFGFYDSRLTAWGQRNRVQNLLNMGFEGGSNGTVAIMPAGWAGPGHGNLVADRIGSGYAFQWTGLIIGPAFTQSAYQDSYGVPILKPSTTYKVRAYIVTSSAVGTVKFQLFSSSAAYLSTATINCSAATVAGGWFEVVFPNPTPSTIPADFLFEFACSNGLTTTLDELSVIDTANPYLDTISYASYINNPTGMDGFSGKWGPSNDSRKIMDMAFLRGTLYVLTQDPSGRIHETNGSDTTEPDGWVVNEVEANCGTLSAFCLTKSQADDSSASGGEEWLSWASESGARIFSGSEAHKVSQELQSAWFDPLSTQNWPQINMAAATAISAVNDPVERVVYFCLPLGGFANTPNRIYAMNYRQLDSAEAIANAPPFHPSLSGNLVATDNTRKWTRWNLTMNGMTRMYRQSGQLTMVLFGGNGQTLGASPGYGNVYTLNPAKLTDDDFGQISPYYVTSPFLGHQDEQMLQLGSHQKMLAYLEAYIAWTGTITITPLLNALANPSALICTRTPSNPTPLHDIEWTGGSITAQRMFFQIASSPLAGQTDNGFSLQKFIPSFRTAARLPVRGSV